MIAEDWLVPHGSRWGEPFEPFTWDNLDKEWRDSPITRYWERLPNLKTKTHERFWETKRQS